MDYSLDLFFPRCCEKHPVKPVYNDRSGDNNNLVCYGQVVVIETVTYRQTDGQPLSADAIEYNVAYLLKI